MIAPVPVHCFSITFGSKVSFKERHFTAQEEERFSNLEQKVHNIDRNLRRFSPSPIRRDCPYPSPQRYPNDNRSYRSPSRDNDGNQYRGRPRTRDYNRGFQGRSVGNYRYSPSGNRNVQPRYQSPSQPRYQSPSRSYSPSNEEYPRGPPQYQQPYPYRGDNRAPGDYQDRNTYNGSYQNVSQYQQPYPYRGDNRTTRDYQDRNAPSNENYQNKNYPTNAYIPETRSPQRQSRYDRENSNKAQTGQTSRNPGVDSGQLRNQSPQKQDLNLKGLAK